MGWYVLGADDQNLLESISMMGVPAASVLIGQPFVISGIAFPDKTKYVQEVIRAIGDDPEKVSFDTVATDQPAYRYFIPRGPTMVDTNVSKFWTTLKKLARRFKTPVGYYHQGSEGTAFLNGSGVRITEASVATTEPTVDFFVEGHKFTMRVGQPHPGRLPLIAKGPSGETFVSAEVAPRWINLLLDIASIPRDAEKTHKLLELILGYAIPFVLDPATAETVARLEVKAREAEADRERRGAEERGRRLAEIGQAERQRWIDLCRERRTSSVVEIDHQQQKTIKTFREKLGELMKVGWEREPLRFRLQALDQMEQEARTAAKNLYNDLAKHPMVDIVLPSEEAGVISIVLKPCPPGAAKAQSFWIKIGQTHPLVSVWRPLGGLTGEAEPAPLEIEVVIALFQMAAAGDLKSVVDLVVETLSEQTNDN